MGLREPLRDLDQGLPMALDAMGERWSFMILRAAFNHVQHFEEFQQELGIARNVLSNRLARLVDHGVLARAPLPEDRRKVVYRLTPKGLDLLPAMIALRQWGEKWGNCNADMPVLVDTRDRMPVAPVAIQSHDGRRLTHDDLGWRLRDEIAAAPDGAAASRCGDATTGTAA